MIPINSPRKKTLLFLLILSFIVLAAGATLLKEESTNNKSFSDNYTLLDRFSDIFNSSNESDGAIREKAWQTFVAYREAAQRKDVEAIKNLSYKISEYCSNPELIEECYARMDLIVDVTADFSRDKFTMVWYDQNQIILFTDPIRMEEDQKVSYKKSYIYFTRDEQGEPKVLGIDPSQVWSFTRGDNKAGAEKTDEEIEKELQSIILDTDKDGVPDLYEICPETKESCEEGETRPNVRDTDGDGWWDGIGDYIKQLK